MPRGIRVLYVDGDDGARELAIRRLERRGFDVVAVDDAAAALEELDEGIDCVVSEYDAPGNDGLELVDAVRERAPGLPFVLFTEERDEGIVGEAVRADVTEYLRKGTGDDRFERLAERIERAVIETHGETGRAEDGERNLADADRLVDAIGNPVYATDADGRITTFNERAEAVTGYDADEVVGERVGGFLDPSDSERCEAVVRELLRTGRRTATFDVAVETADGDTLVLENTLALRTDDGEFRGTIGVLRIDETRTDSRLRRLHDATRELMSATDPERIAELTTDAAEEILDLPIATVRFQEGDVLELVAATERTIETMGERPPFPIEETLAGKAFNEGEPHVDPDITDVEDPVRPEVVESVAYFPLGEYGVFVTAATERDAFDESDIQLATILAANAEAALDRAHKEEALRRERDDLAALFENIPDPTVETVVRDGRPVVERVNPAFESVFGYESETIEGENLDEYIVPSDCGSEARTYNERTGDGEGFHGEVRRLAADGLRDFILHVAPHDVDEGTVRGYAIYTDITDRKRRERELERQNERLDQFASVVSHDLRNPLSVARGHLELARTSGDEEHFDAVERAHGRMEELIEGLLAFARRGELTADSVELELEAVAEDAWATVETGDLSLSFADPPAITADPERLRQLLENLFRNAVEHGETVTTVTVGALDGRSGFYVEDDGVGIPEAERGEVLESGYSGADGTGFGLAIVETIAEAHGWRVEVGESEAGGARFEFRDDSTVDD